MLFPLAVASFVIVRARKCSAPVFLSVSSFLKCCSSVSMALGISNMYLGLVDGKTKQGSFSSVSDSATRGLWSVSERCEVIR